MFPRTKELIGLAMVGDGLLGLVQTQRHMRLWTIGPKPVKDVMRYFDKRPMATKALSAAEVVLGLWLSHEQTPEKAN